LKINKLKQEKYYVTSLARINKTYMRELLPNKLDESDLHGGE